jgi:galactofuranosylgalactofuranosylrhamnosyl-N-acetylglucosaminyl-diphospho-decaprenol beta-1,5/1,6-galactofuranosyltransferase
MSGNPPASAPALPEDRVSPQPATAGPAGRQLAQRALFTGPVDEVPAELYTEVVRGIAHRERRRLVVSPESEVSTNTYFGRFPASYWQRWSTATEVEATGVYTGSGQLRLIASDANSDPRTLAAQDLHGAVNQPVTLTAKIDKFVDGGAVWVEFVTAEKELAVEDLWYTVEAGQDRATAVVICTCNRVEDCLNTLTALAGDPVALGALTAVYVADQGHDTLDSRPRFAEVEASLGGKLRYIKQPNLGGAAGFTRGMYEFAESAEPRNVLLMDDDILCEPDIVVRLTAFASRMTKPVIVGGQMLNLLHPNTILASAEFANLETLTPGLVPKDSLFYADLTGVDEKTGKKNLQDRRVDTGYNGWWSCLIPNEIVKAIRYPLPLFFQWDDVEYAHRAAEHGFATVTLPGAGVWHADFHWKDWDEWHRYFNLRNGLITAALHSPFTVKVVARYLVEQLSRYLISMQYGLSVTLLKAVEDFLEGPEILRDGGLAAMQEIRRIRADYPETVKRGFGEAGELANGNLPMIRSGPTPSLIPAVAVKRVLFQLLGRSVHHAGTIPAGDAEWWHVSLFDTAVVTDFSQEGVRVRKRDKDTALRLAKDGLRVLRRFLKEAPGVVERYRAAMPELTSRENWARLYGRED